jgi:myo-inositol-1(or 4)-monophosphatase
MNSKNYKEYLDLATKLAKTAGEKLAKEFNQTGRYEFSLKGKADIVTKADKIAEEIIISGINAKYPDHALLSEESGKKDEPSDFMWIIDPLDGTTNFSIKLPFFNTCITLVHKEQIVLGVVYDPINTDMYTATINQPTRLNGEEVKPNTSKDIESTFHSFCYGSGQKDKLNAAKYYKTTKEKGMPARQLGAGALELARVASGVLDSFYNPGAKVWDVAAGSLIVRKAGGVATDLEGNPYTIDSQSGILAASNPELHEKLMNLIP